jgi:membrane dipeptidase
LTRPIAEIRAAETGLRDKPGRGCGTVCLPEMRRGRVGLAVVTQIGRVERHAALGDFKKHKPRTRGARRSPCHCPVAVWQSPAQAWAMTQGQLAWYRAMEEAGEIGLVASRADLERHVAAWQSESSVDALPIGCILSLEGADSLITLGHLERAYAHGLRAVGPAHYGPGRYANGTNSTGGLPPAGRELLAEMERLRVILDVTHLTDDCFWEAMKVFSGHVWASHSNCRALVPHQRQMADEQIRALVERDAVIGVVLDGWMLVPGWVQDQTTSEARDLRLEKVVEHIDHICQMAGNAAHVGLGSDLDGGFGGDQSPRDLQTIADVSRLSEMLLARGWTQPDVSAFAHGNLLRILRRALR